MSEITDSDQHAMLEVMRNAKAECAAEISERVVVLEGLLRDVEMPQTVRKAVLHHLQRMMLAVSR